MNTSLGYSKKTLTNSNVLLSGGGDKALSEFIGSLNWDSTNKKLQYKSASSTNFTDLITFGSNAFNSTSYLPLSGGTMVGTISAANDAYGGGGFHNGYANIILRGNTTTGTSGIVFSSSKGDTSINRPSDCAFIQYQPYGVSAATAVGTNPTINTSGEAGRFVIGIYNDSGDQLWLQTREVNDLKHVVGANIYTILDSNNSSVSKSGETLTVKINGTSQSLTNTWTAWAGATDSANGTAGYMPAPTSALRGQFLRGDGTWVSLNNYSLPTASNSTLGGVKTGAAITDTTGYTAVAIKDGVIYYKDTNTTYSFSNLLFLQTSGTNLMTYNSQAARTVLAGSNITFTHSNNILTIAAKDTTYSTVSKTAAGLCPILPNETTTTKYLRQDGTWVTPPNDNTWKAANASQEGYVPKSTANKILRANGEGVLYWGDDANTTYTFYNLLFQNSSGTTVDTYKPTTSPTKTLKAGDNVTISTASNVITIASTNTWNAMTGATSSANGTVGYVNAAPPKDGYNTKFLRADGTWSVPAYPTKASWDYDDRYVSYLTTSGNHLRWVKNGVNNDITIPYASNAEKVLGFYTSNGGRQNPDYFGKNRVGFLMMNTTVNGNSQYKDWVIMDCYNGSDVGGGVAIGVNRQSLGAYIMRSAAERTSWDESAELCGTHNSSVSLSGSTLTVKIAGVEKSLTNTNTWRGIQNNLTSDSTTDSLSAALGKALANGSARDNTKLPLSGGTMTGVINWGSGATREILQFTTDGAWKSGLRYSWSNSTTISLWGKHKDTAFVWNAGTDAEINGHGSTNYDFRIRRESDVVVARISGHIVYHAGNLPAYPTKASWNYDDRYVSNVALSGNYLRITKNGANTDLTIPYATSATSAEKAEYTYSIYKYTGQSTYNVAGQSINDSMTSDKLTRHYNGTLFPVFHNTDWGWSDTLYWSGYDKWGGTELATQYNAGSNVRVKIRKYYQSTNNWGNWTEFITSGNIGSQSVNYANSAGSVAWDNVSGKPDVAIRQSANNFIIAGDEFNFIPDNYNNRVRFNCYSPSRDHSALVTEYWFDNGRGGTIAKILSTGEYSGTISWSNVTGGRAYLPLDTAHYFRDPTSSSWRGGIYWGSAGNEAMSFVAANASTRFLFVIGSDIANWGNSTWLSASCAMYITSSGAYAVNFYTTSDKSKKQNISSFSEHICKFQMKDTKTWHYGVIAQEVPEMFRLGEEGNMTVNYNSVLSYYVGCLENSVAGLEDAKRCLENKVKELEEKIKVLETKLNKLI